MEFILEIGKSCCLGMYLGDIGVRKIAANSISYSIQSVSLIVMYFNHI